MPKEPIHHLRKRDRQIIRRMHKAKHSQQAIAEVLGCAQSTISKELSRNSGGRGYRPKQAEKKAQLRQRRKRPRGRVIAGGLEAIIRERLERKHSPEQICGSLRREGLRAPSVSSLYNYIQADRRRGGQLYAHLRINGSRRYRHRNKATRHKIKHRVEILERPQVVQGRNRYGDWEADLLEGSRRQGYILSLYERKSRYARLVKLPRKSANRTAQAIIRTLRHHRVHTLTYDNGREFAHHHKVNRELNCRSYFCRPHHPWEKGGVENYNGLLRQYLPKTTCLRTLSRIALARIETELNHRPRKTLHYRSPQSFTHLFSA